MNVKKNSVVAGVVSLSALFLIVIAMGASGSSDRSPSSGGDSRVQAGFDIAPVHLDLRGKNRARVGTGSYLVNAVGGCNDCHTCPSYAEGVSHNPFVGGDGMINRDGYLAGGVPFELGPGFTLYAANLTPDERGRPAGMMFDEFRTTLRTGRDHEDPDEILQVMPWPVFRNMTDQDLRSIYEYLRAIPSRETPPPGTCQFAGQGTFPEGR